MNVISLTGLSFWWKTPQIIWRELEWNRRFTTSKHFCKNCYRNKIFFYKQHFLVCNMGESSIKTVNVGPVPWNLVMGNCESDKQNWTIFTNSSESISNVTCSKVHVHVFAKLSLWILQNSFNYQDPQRSWIWFLRIL